MGILKIIIIPYILFLLYLLFLGMGRFQYEENLITVEPVFSTIKFIQSPNKTIDIVKIVLGNVIMLIPFGFMGWVIPRLKKLKLLMFDFISCIVIIEALQYFTRMGIFEVDDITKYIWSVSGLVAVRVY